MSNKVLPIIFFFFFLESCTFKSTNRDDIRKKGDALLDNIATGNAESNFPLSYFPIQQTQALMSDLKNDCDFKNRNGHFLNDYYSEDKSKLSLIYEFYLKCDSIRFILTYDIKQEELYEFKMEAIEKDNPKISDQTKRLKY